MRFRSAASGAMCLLAACQRSNQTATAPPIASPSPATPMAAGEHVGDCVKIDIGTAARILGVAQVHAHTSGHHHLQGDVDSLSCNYEGEGAVRVDIDNMPSTAAATTAAQSAAAALL